MRYRYNAIVGFSASLLFALFYIAGAFNSLENRLYDFFMRFRADRARVDNVVFLDIDDSAIFYNGVFPWPRSIMAEGLLRLKEYGVRAAIFDIEYIDHGPQGVDSLYLNQGLSNDFNRSFSEINSNAQEIFSALKSGRIGRSDIDFYAGSFLELVNDLHKDLYTRAQGIARDNDRYLAQALSILGNGWSTLNLREYPLDGEQAQRRPIAERFAYPVNASADAHNGAGFIDILPALPLFAQAAKGSGFTNVEVDADGIRRGIYLAQKIDDYWYLQLAFAPLINYFGNPEILLEHKKLIVKQAHFPDGRLKDIVIPLDQKGRMMLDWPKEDYKDSYSHISFAQFSLLDEIETELEFYVRALADADIWTFAQFDPSINRAPVILANITDLLDAMNKNKGYAIEYASENFFDNYIECRNEAYRLLGELISLDINMRVTELALQLSEEYPEEAEMINSEAEYIAQLVDILKINFDQRKEISAENEKMFKDKFCIMGRVDTGTTDIGSNPFYGTYVNVGTHGVVLDTILSESFIILLGKWHRILFLLIVIPLFFILTARLSPVIRAGSGFFAALAIFITAVLLFRFTGIYWGPLGAVLAMAGAVIVREVIAFAGSEKEKKFIRTAFSTYVSDDVVKEIISDPSRLQLGGTKRHMTAIFTDVRSFSTISEQLDPESLVSLLNRYLGAMSDVILAEKGTIDKYEGDAIIAFFGAPLELKDHALHACLSAIAMRKLETELNKTIMEQKLSPMPLLTRIGINTGDMVAGNMGTANKMNYTIMGNAVNLAARLEGVNKQYGTWILASEDTVRETGGKL
ncbi:MAG: adenylate/guanylate cyclase domain-containing protein, partial [Treponema sp.]|nr:adenylate/guanylate cyclase domain-containing protein [Treponema sp.]